MQVIPHSVQVTVWGASVRKETFHDSELNANCPRSIAATLIRAGLFYPSAPLFFMSLPGQAREWGMAIWDARAPCCASFVEFRLEMRRLFDCSVRGDEAAAKLSRLSQGQAFITDHSIQFQTLSAAWEWNAVVLRALEGHNDTDHGCSSIGLFLSPYTWKPASANNNHPLAPDPPPSVSLDSEPMQLG